MEDQGKFEQPGEGQNLSCTDFDLLLSDAIDGMLSPARQAGFERHVNTCPTCGPIFTDTQAGQHWLKSLEAVPVPGNLVHNILAATSMKDIAATAQIEQRESWYERFSHVLRTVFHPVYKTMRQPRFVLNTSMAFFSLTLLMNVAGFRLSDLRTQDLSFRSIKTNASLKYYETTAKVVKYYENIRFVYELESTVRELKRASTPKEQDDSAPKKKYDNTTQKPEQKQNEEQEYVRERNGILLAALKGRRSLMGRDKHQISPGSNNQMKLSTFVDPTYRRLA